MKKTSILPAGLTLAGDIEGDEDLVVLGRVDGSIEIDGALVIEASGAVRGDVRARTVTVRGILCGDAHAQETIWVEDGARMVGDLVGPRVQVNDGARFRGHVRVLSQDRPAPVRVPPRRAPSQPPAPLPAPRPALARAEVREIRDEPPEVLPVRRAPSSTPPARVPAGEPRRAPLPRMPAIGRATARRRVG